MRRIIPHRPTTIVSSLCAAVDGGRVTIAATSPTAGDGGFLPTDPKPNARTPHTDIFGVFVGQSAWAVTARKQLKNEERARKALGILFRDYGGRDTQDDESDEEKVAKTNTRKLSEEELDAFLSNLVVECGTDHEKYEIVRKEFHELIENLTKDDESDDELGDATQDDRVDKLAEIAEEELDAFLTNSFTAKLMIECEPEYEKLFREIIQKVRKKMIQDDRILQAFELVTYFMKCESEYEKLLCEVLEKVREKITQDGGNDNIRKIEKLAKLDMKVWDKYNFEEELDKFVTGKFLKKLRDVEETKPYFMAYEVIEKVAKKVGNENLRKIAEKEMDALVTDYFTSEIVGFRMIIPYFMYEELVRPKRLEGSWNAGGAGSWELKEY